MKRSFLLILCLSAALAVRSQTVTTVKVSELNTVITDNIVKTQVGYTIKGAHKIDNKGVTTYEVVIVKGSSETTLLYDKDGKFIRKVMVKSGTVITKEVPKKKNINDKPKSETVKK